MPSKTSSGRPQTAAPARKRTRRPAGAEAAPTSADAEAQGLTAVAADATPGPGTEPGAESAAPAAPAKAADSRKRAAPARKRTAKAADHDADGTTETPAVPVAAADESPADASPVDATADTAAHAAEAKAAGPARKTSRKPAGKTARKPTGGRRAAPAEADAEDAQAAGHPAEGAQALEAGAPDAGAEPSQNLSIAAAPETAAPADATPAPAEPAPVVTEAAPIAPPPPPPPPPPARISAPAGGALVGVHRVQLLDENDEPVGDVTLRTADAATASCTCLEFALAEAPGCSHVHALFAHLRADRAWAEALAAVQAPATSRLLVQQGAERHLLWLPGHDCPAPLREQAQALAAVPVHQLDDQALPRLLRAARDAGHELQVDESVWQQLAAARDPRWRVQRLEQLLPQGPATPSLRELLAAEGPGAAQPPLLPLQLEAALFALCAGRCVLADTPELSPERQALAAAALWQQHFGVERVLLLAPSDSLGRWRARLPASASGWSLMALETVASDVERHASLAPDLVIVQEPADGGLWVDAERAAALLRLASPFALVLSSPDLLHRPAELPLRVAFVDRDRLGAYAALLQVHGERDEHGELQGLCRLDALRDTLARVLLLRTRDEVLGQLPERVDRVVTVALPAEAQAALAERTRAVATTVRRWQHRGWLSDAEQRQLHGQVQALRRLCAGADAAAVADAKAAALCAQLDTAEGAVAKLVVFSQWPDALDAVASRLAARGIGHARWSARDGTSHAQAAARRFADDTNCRVLLVADPGSGGLELPPSAAHVLHFDRPWNSRLLTRRFGRVHRRGKAHLVPVTHLVLADSVETGLVQVLGDRREPVPDWLDAQAAEGFLQGAELAAFMDDLARVIGLPVPAAPDAPDTAAPAAA